MDIENQAGDTPLHFAARRSSCYELQLLLDKNASVSARNRLGELPLHVAALWNNVAAVDLLSKHIPDHILADMETEDEFLKGMPRSPLYLCAERLYTEAMYAMLVYLKKNDVEKRDQNERRVLHYAAVVKNVDLISHLAKMGVDLDPRDENLDTPVLLAIRSSFPGNTLKACEALMDAGASVAPQNSQGESPWDVAFSKRRTDVITYFLHHSALACQNVTVLEYLNPEHESSRVSAGQEVHELTSRRPIRNNNKKSNRAQKRKVIHKRRCCREEILRLGIHESNGSLLIALKERIQAEESAIGTRSQPEEPEDMGFSARLQEALKRLASNPWSRLGEPTNVWLSTKWRGQEPEFERFPGSTTLPKLNAVTELVNMDFLRQI